MNPAAPIVAAPASPPPSPSSSAAAAVLVSLPSCGGASAPPDDSSEATEDGRPSGGAVSDTAASEAVARTTQAGLKRKACCGPLVVAAGGRKPASSTSKYHGVTKHRWSGKYEAHLWDSNTRVEGRRRKGKQGSSILWEKPGGWLHELKLHDLQDRSSSPLTECLVYLGSYDCEEKAARTHDLAALKYWGTSSRVKFNFPIAEYDRELEGMKHMSQDECVASLRRKSCCFSRGSSVYRGVTRRQKDGRWQARIGRVAGTRDIYLGTFKTEEEAAEAYDIAAIELRGPSAITNFDISNYCTRGFGELEEEEDLEQLDSSVPCKVEL